MWKFTAWSQRCNWWVHWEGMAKHSPGTGQGAVLQHGCAPAAEGSRWALLTGLHTQGGPGGARSEGWERRVLMRPKLAAGKGSQAHLQ